MHTTPLHKICLSLARQIATAVAHLPGGYAFTQALPSQGHRCLSVATKHWAEWIHTACYPHTLKIAMLTAALSEDGVVDTRGKELYQWLLGNVYKGDTRKLYSEWLLIQQVSLQQGKGTKR